MTDKTPQPFDPATIPPERRAIAMIGREVRVVEWVPDETEQEETDAEQ